MPLVWTARCIQARISNKQPLYRLIANDVRIDDLIDICRRDPAIPHGIRIDDDVGAMLALVEASGLVRSNGAFDSSLCQLDFKNALEFRVAGGIAAAARIIGRPLVTADKDVPVEFGHAQSQRTQGFSHRTSGRANCRENPAQ